MSRQKDAAAEVAASKKRTDDVLAKVGLMAFRLHTELQKLEQVLEESEGQSG